MGLADLPAQLAEQSSWPARFEVLQRALLRALRRHERAGPRPEVARAMAMLTRGMPVAETADEVGVAPKTYQRLARFAGARDRMQRAVLAGDVSVAAVAAASGYADQAHLAREWGELAGCSPTEWVRREFPIVQATGVGSAAEWR